MPAPSKKVTGLNPNKPTESHTSAPTITKIKEIMLVIFINPSVIIMESFIKIIHKSIFSKTK